MKPQNQILSTIVVFAMAYGCTQKSSNTFELKGTLEGIIDGKITLFNSSSDDIAPDTAIIKNGRFVFRGDSPEPSLYHLEMNGQYKFFYVENVRMTLKGKADSLSLADIEGSRVNNDYDKHMKIIRERQEKYGSSELLEELGILMEAGNEIPDKLQIKYDSVVALLIAEIDSIDLAFIRENPSSYYSAVLLDQKSYGLGAEEIEEMLNLLDPSLSEYKIVDDLYKLADNLKHSDVGVSEFISDAPDVNYKVDATFNGAEHKDIVYLAALSNDNICGLGKDGNVIIIDPKGNILSQFKPDLKSGPSAMAADLTSDELYVFGTLTEKSKRTIRGKEYEIVKSVGVECLVYDTKGSLLRTLDLKELKCATGAKVKNGKVIVADFENKMISVFNSTTGTEEASTKDLRVCCGILDFGINNNDEILIANLGAFRVNVIDFSGQDKFAFGKRGQTLSDFHGCCNPVNVACLSSGAIITVEKDPTRIKIYARSGAKKIDGIEELVRGCAYIPVIIDSKDNIYLASPSKGIIKCKVN